MVQPGPGHVNFLPLALLLLLTKYRRTSNTVFDGIIVVSYHCQLYGTGIISVLIAVFTATVTINIYSSGNCEKDIKTKATRATVCYIALQSSVIWDSLLY